jgi:hypothetical protein
LSQIFYKCNPISKDVWQVKKGGDSNETLKFNLSEFIFGRILTESSIANCCFAVRVSSWLMLSVIYSWLNGWSEHDLLASDAREAPTFMKILLHPSSRYLDEESRRFFRKVCTRVHKHAEKHHFPNGCNLNIQPEISWVNTHLPIILSLVYLNEERVLEKFITLILRKKKALGILRSFY